ncbi:hypothetical protein [Aquipuribacter nitratireducens]|uniref:Uncharacterized protein n=1 Tax=Aquipuribacter nitratireducens TaxID=650104 RepID=A0ABW0GND5_9MICO
MLDPVELEQLGGHGAGGGWTVVLEAVDVDLPRLLVAEDESGHAGSGTGDG